MLSDNAQAMLDVFPLTRGTMFFGEFADKLHLSLTEIEEAAMELGQAGLMQVRIAPYWAFTRESHITRKGQKHE